MVELNLSHNNYYSLLQELAMQLKATPVNDSITIPKNIGNGVIKIIQLPNKLQVLMLDIFFYKDVVIKTGSTNANDHVLNFAEKEITPENFSPENKITHTYVRLTGKNYSNWETVKKNSSIRYLKILFSKSWLDNYEGLSEQLSLFEKYIPLKSGEGNQKLNEDYRQIINELWNPPQEDFLQNMYYQNRILLLIEHFFTRMQTEMTNADGKYKLGADDIIKLEEVEARLHSFEIPLNINELAKSFSLSKVKLAEYFRQVYGSSISAWYQKLRMQRAHELLSSKKFSVKEVSEKLGYNNLSNFILAFTKQFDIPPKSLLE